MPTADVFDVGAADFQARVLEASRQRPVLVDFWAAWCGPCRMLEPVLERIVARHTGAVALARVDTDREQELASRHGVRSLPTVKLFRHAQVAGEFLGARPEGEVEAFLAPHLPDPAADDLREAAELVRLGRSDEAITRLEAARAANPASVALAAALGEHYLGRGRVDEARALYDALPAPAQAEAPGRVLAARLRFANALTDASPPGVLAERAERGDAGALFMLAAYDVMAGDCAAAADRLFRILQRDPHWNRDGARHALLDLMEIAGETERVAHWRRRLARLLY